MNTQTDKTTDQFCYHFDRWPFAQGKKKELFKKLILEMVDTEIDMTKDFLEDGGPKQDVVHVGEWCAELTMPEQLIVMQNLRDELVGDKMDTDGSDLFMEAMLYSMLNVELDLTSDHKDLDDHAMERYNNWVTLLASHHGYTKKEVKKMLDEHDRDSLIDGMLWDIDFITFAPDLNYIKSYKKYLKNSQKKAAKGLTYSVNLLK